MSLLSAEAGERLLHGSRSVYFPAGTITNFAGGTPILGLIEKGMVRAFTGSPDGRQASVAYRHVGELIGGAFVFGKVQAMANIQAVVDLRFRSFDFEHVAKLVRTDVEVADAMGAEVSARLVHSYQVITVRSLGSIRERLVFDLLDRACETQLREGKLVARVTHEELAASIGSAREVVTRTIAELRRAEILEGRPGELRVIDPVQMMAIIRGVLTQVA
jgi:CRP/FNR family cyclic AMP-dependent transcriptional regulator